MDPKKPDDLAENKTGLFSIIQNKVRDEVDKRPGFVFALLTTVVFLALLFYWPIRITQTRQLTALEQTLFQLFLVLLSFLFSWLLAKRSEEQNILATQKALARSAARRITDITTSASRLQEEVTNSRDQFESASEWQELDKVRKRLIVEILDGLSRQLREIQSNVAASVEDWRDILPEEFKKKEAAEKLILQEYESALEEARGTYRTAIEELTKAVSSRDAQANTQLDQFKKLFGEQVANLENRLSVKIEQIRSDIEPSLSVPVAASGSFFEPPGSLDFFGSSSPPAPRTFGTFRRRRRFGLGTTASAATEAKPTDGATPERDPKKA